MAQAQKKTATQPITDEVAIELRKLYPDYDRWTLQDVASRPTKTIIDGLIATISDRVEWHQNIPQAIRNQYGEEAPRLFIIAAYDRLATARNYDDPMTTSIRAVISNNLKLTEKEADKLVLDRPITVVFANGQEITATPAQVMLHQISRRASDPALSDLQVKPKPGEPFFGSLGGIIDFPNSLLDGLKRENPKFAKRLEALRGKAVFSVDPQDVYYAGQVGQLRGANNIADWSTDWKPTAMSDPNFCVNIAVIERDLTNLKTRDVRVDEAQIAGAARASDVCPVTLGEITPSLPAANNNTASRVPIAKLASR